MEILAVKSLTCPGSESQDHLISKPLAKSAEDELTMDVRILLTQMMLLYLSRTTHLGCDTLTIYTLTPQVLDDNGQIFRPLI